MDFEPAEYVRKVFTVKAEEVTYENIEAVAEWCKGRLDTEATKVVGGNEIKLPVIKLQGRGEDLGKELIARLGCFVVYSKGRFRVYNEPQFHRAFEKVQSEKQFFVDDRPFPSEAEGQAEADQEHEDALHAAGQL